MMITTILYDHARSLRRSLEGRATQTHSDLIESAAAATHKSIMLRLAILFTRRYPDRISDLDSRAGEWKHVKEANKSFSTNLRLW
jgi:hypothetical protein